MRNRNSKLPLRVVPANPDSDSFRILSESGLAGFMDFLD